MRTFCRSLGCRHARRLLQKQARCVAGAGRRLGLPWCCTHWPCAMGDVRPCSQPAAGRGLRQSERLPGRPRLLQRGSASALWAQAACLQLRMPSRFHPSEVHPYMNGTPTHRLATSYHRPDGLVAVGVRLLRASTGMSIADGAAPSLGQQLSVTTCHGSIAVKCDDELCKTHHSDHEVTAAHSPTIARACAGRCSIVCGVDWQVSDSRVGAACAVRTAHSFQTPAHQAANS
jgi:hypothetical protein